MLIIRKAQMAALSDIYRARYEEELVRHFVTVYPREVADAGGEKQIARLVSAAGQRANSQGFGGSSKNLGLFVALTFILGVAFDEDPQIPWAGEQLRDASLSAAFRVETVYDGALDYLGATAGEQCEHLVRAMLRIRSYNLERIPDVSGDRWVDEFAPVLRDLYPRKFDYQGASANRNLIALGVENAERSGLRSHRGKGIWVALMFMLGSGFDRDPLYPWAREALAGAGGEDHRAERLYSLAMRHLEGSLTPDIAASVP